MIGCYKKCIKGGPALPVLGNYPIDALADKSKNMNNFVWGCGCVSIDTPREHLLKFKEMCLTAASLSRKENL